MTLAAAGPDYYGLSNTGKSIVTPAFGINNFVFTNVSTGDIFLNDADVITDFNAGSPASYTDAGNGVVTVRPAIPGDMIFIPAGLTYGGQTSSPSLGTYSVWSKDGGYVVTWRDETGWNDIHVFGDDPTDAIVSNVQYDAITAADAQVETFVATGGSDVFIFEGDDTGEVFVDEADTIVGFDASMDRIIIPTAIFAGSTQAPRLNEYAVWTQDDTYVVTWRDADGYHDVVVMGDDPTGAIISDDVEVF